jgi:hypothetical protein
MASKKKQELEQVVEMIKDMRYVDKLRDAISECIAETRDEMIDDDGIECDNGALIEMALEELVLGEHYSGKDVEDRTKEWEEDKSDREEAEE